MERPTQHLRHIPRQTGDQSDESARLSQHSTIEVEDQASISSHEASSPAPRQNQITAHSYSSIHGDKKQHYKPISTKTSILCTFFVASLLFIAGIEFVVRHSIPIMPPTAKSISSGQPLLGKAMVKSPFEGLVHDVLPSYTDRLVVKNCIGIEMIISKTNNNTIPSTFTQPIYNVPVSTMPCYACAMQSQGIIAKGFVTATTTRCDSCIGAVPPTVYPCSTCEGIVLTVAPVLQSTPTAQPRPYIEYSKGGHEHKRSARSNPIKSAWISY